MRPDSEVVLGGSLVLKNLYGDERVTRTQEELDIILAAHQRYAAHQGGKRAILVHINLNGLNLANRDLQEADFSGASLAGASLYGANLQRASLYCADLRDCDLRAAKMTRADMRGAFFRGANLSHAVLDNADLRSGMMMYVGADGASRIDHGGGGKPDSPATGVPHGVDFSNCSLKGVSFGNARLDGANFTGALLQGATFKNAKLTNVIFKDAVLTGVNLQDLPREALEGCIMDVTPQALAKAEKLKVKLDAHQQWLTSAGQQGAPAVLDGEDLRPLHQLFTGRHLTGLSMRQAIAIGIDFSGSRLQAAKFDGADLRDANFSNADIRGASFKGAKLLHANFDKADLRALSLADGTRHPADFSETETAQEQLRTCIRDTPS
jgi:uncharacterized protein YjbI with pentapeptide repeats